MAEEIRKQLEQNVLKKQRNKEPVHFSARGEMVQILKESFRLQHVVVGSNWFEAFSRERFRIEGGKYKKQGE